MYDDENMTRLDGAETEDSDESEFVVDDEFMQMFNDFIKSGNGDDGSDKFRELYGDLLDSDDDELNNIIVMNDEDGNECEFEFLDMIEYDGEEYVVLLPVDDDEDDDGGEVVILKCDDSHAPDGEEGYVSIDDEDVLQAVFEIFKERFADEFDFTD